MTEEKLIRQLIVKRDDIMTGVMMNPPTTIEEFNKRWGRWAELCEIIVLMAEAAKGLEDDDQDLP